MIRASSMALATVIALAACNDQGREAATNGHDEHATHEHEHDHGDHEPMDDAAAERSHEDSGNGEHADHGENGGHDKHGAHDDHAEHGDSDKHEAHAEEQDAHDHGAAAEEDGERDILYWYDPMHPDVHFDEPGPSPFMDMDLVPRYADEVTPGEVEIPPGIQQVMSIRTARAEKGPLARRIDTVGHVAFDESQRHHLHPRVEGWIEHLAIADVGDRVREGQLLFTLYAPELVNAQEELLQAQRRDDAATMRAARSKLRALGVQPEAIDAVEKAGEVQEALPWRARRDGVVTRLGVRHGMHVTPGTELLELADLSEVWVIAEVFDRHAGWLATGQRAEIRSHYLPGERLEAAISHIYPMLAPQTRTLRVRLPIDNPDGRLKPGMWADVRIEAGSTEEVVHIPREALIRTGQRERVVLHEADDRFRVREVVAGAHGGDRIAIIEGIEEGERVVVSGQFLIDSEAARDAGYQRLEGPEEAEREDQNAQPEAVPGEGEVIDMNPEAGRIELRHAPIAELDWPEMTMGFQIDPALLPEGLEPGDKVRFRVRAEPDDAGRYRLVALEIDDAGDGS